MNGAERDEYCDALVERAATGEITWGQVVRSLRKDVASLNQATFARAVNISVRTLRNLENDDGNPTLATLEAVLKSFRTN